MTSETINGSLPVDEVEGHDPPTEEIRIPSGRERAAEWFAAFAVGVFLMGPTLLGLMWLTAWREGNMPPDQATWGSNHGPWRHLEPEGTMFDYAIAIPPLSLIPAIVSLVLKPSCLVGALFAAVPAYLLFTFVTHLWLFD
jgi:hypothetical protein